MTTWGEYRDREVQRLAGELARLDSELRKDLGPILYTILKILGKMVVVVNRSRKNR